MTLTDATVREREWAQCYRMSAKWKLFSLGFILFCAVIPIVGSLAILLLAAPGEKLHGVAVVWCASSCGVPFLAMGVWFYLAVRRYRLFLGDDALYERGITREKIVAIAEIQQVRWNPLIDGGMIEAHGPFGKVDVTLLLLRAVDRPPVIAWFRECVPADQQSNWDLFEDWILPSPAARRRNLRWQAAGYGIAAAALLIAWLTGLLGDQMILGIIFSIAIGQFGRWFMTA